MAYNEGFCKMYNTFGWNYYPESFGEMLLQWLRKEQIQVQSAVDLGCGTGMLCHVLAEAGIQTLGVDLAEEMIRTAEINWPELDFVQADITCFQPKQPVELVTATCDVFNHLLEEEMLERAFGRIRGYLRAEGVFIFDLLKPEEVQPFSSIEIGVENDRRYEYRITDKGNRLVELGTAVYDVGSGATISKDVIYERLHEPETIQKLLKKCGFTDVRICDTLSEESGRHGTDWIFVCR
ncbi:MAG: class I SAM-dependent methyltransferase [Eubacteriales bacterium]|nr:class I SAM-dependent methyltransferase [Eubacteriales bacterium]